MSGKYDNQPRKSTRELFGAGEQCYIMDAKSIGNIGRYLNVSLKRFGFTVLHVYA